VVCQVENHIKTYLKDYFFLGIRLNYWWMKLQWQVEKGTQIKPLYILGYTSNLGRVKKEVLK